MSRPRPLDAVPWVVLVVVLMGMALSPWPALTLLLAIVFALLAWRWLEHALCLLPLTFPYWFVPRALIGSAVFPLSEIALAACVLAALARELPKMLQSNRLVRLRAVLSAARQALGPWLIAGIVAFALGLTLGLLVARMPREALRAWRWEVLEPLVYLALVLRSVRGRAAIRLLVGAMLASALVLAALAIVQVLWWHVTFTPLATGNRLIHYQTAAGDVPRATAIIFGSGNALGAWMARALPLVLVLVVTPAFGRRTRLLALGGAASCTLALVWSGSRGALIAALVAMVVVLALVASNQGWAWLRRSWPAVAVALAALALALWGSGALPTLLAEHPGSAEMRPLLWLAAAHMLLDHPLLGIGPDQFLYYYSNLYTNHPYWITVFNGMRTEVWREPNLSHPHNLLLELWLSGGILALVGFVLVLGVAWRHCLRLWRAGQAGTTEARHRAALALGIGASLLAGVLHGIVDSAYFAPDLALLFWWSLAVILLLSLQETDVSGSDAT